MVAIVITAVIMIFVIPAFKSVFTSFGADLPTPTLVVMAISDWFVANWYIIFPAMGGAHLRLPRGLEALARGADLHGQAEPEDADLRPLLRKAAIARWTRTLSTMFAAGVPLVEALDSVGGASGNYVYLQATIKIKQRGLDRHLAHRGDAERRTCSRPMVIQMC